MKYIQLVPLLFFHASSSYALISQLDPYLPHPMDQLQESLLQIRVTPAVKALRKGMDALKSQKYAKAQSIVRRFKNEGAFRDYAHWVSAQALLANARTSFEKRRYGQAIENAKASMTDLLKIEGEFPSSPTLKKLPQELAKNELVLGDAYWGLEKYQLANENFQKALLRLQAQKGFYFVEISQLKHYAESCQEDASANCVGWLQKLVAAFPKKSLEAQAIAESYKELPEPLKFSNYSRREDSKITQTYKAPDQDQASYDLAMKNYYSDNFGAARKALEQFFTDFPRSGLKQRARFWLAQTFQREKQTENARKTFELVLKETPLSYFGLLAAKEVDRAIDVAIQADFPMGSELSEALTVQEQMHLARGRELLAGKVPELAGLELKELRSNDHLSSPFLLYLAMLNYKAQSYLACFNQVGELIQRGYDGITSSYGLHLIFPQHQLELIKEEAKKNDLDPLVVLSLVKQESAFEDLAISPSGAVGLMQLMPTTALEVEPGISLLDIRDPKNNIRTGTRYLKKLLTKFNGNLVFSLAAYNAGPHAVDRWIKDLPPKRSMAEFIESIPYKETREYVASIIRNYFWYSRQIRGVTEYNFDSFWKDPATINLEKKPEKKTRIRSRTENA